MNRRRNCRGNIRNSGFLKSTEFIPSILKSPEFDSVDFSVDFSREQNCHGKMHKSTEKLTQNSTEKQPHFRGSEIDGIQLR